MYEFNAAGLRSLHQNCRRFDANKVPGLDSVGFIDGYGYFSIGLTNPSVAMISPMMNVRLINTNDFAFLCLLVAAGSDNLQR